MGDAERATVEESDRQCRLGEAPASCRSRACPDPPAQVSPALLPVHREFCQQRVMVRSVVLYRHSRHDLQVGSVD